MVKPGEADGQLWAGSDPAALWESRDGGVTWSRNEALWKERIAGDWQPGLGGLALHSICPWPGEPMKLAIAVSAAGVWLTDDGGESWRTGYTGLVPEYMPEEVTCNDQRALRAQHAPRAAAARAPVHAVPRWRLPKRRCGSTWTDIREGLPSPFGFPFVIDPGDPDSAFVIPMVGRRGPRGAGRHSSPSTPRATPECRGRPRMPGCRRPTRIVTILRQAFDRDGEGEGMGLWFGATSGEVFGSVDAGATLVHGRPAISTCDERARSVRIVQEPPEAEISRVRPRRYGGVYGRDHLDRRLPRRRRAASRAASLGSTTRSSKLDPLIRARATSLSPTVERELQAIAIAVNAGRPRQAARRAERLAGLLQHPASG